MMHKKTDDSGIVWAVAGALALGSLIVLLLAYYSGAQWVETVLFGTIMLGMIAAALYVLRVGVRPLLLPWLVRLARAGIVPIRAIVRLALAPLRWLGSWLAERMRPANMGEPIAYEPGQEWLKLPSGAHVRLPAGSDLSQLVQWLNQQQARIAELVAQLHASYARTQSQQSQHTAPLRARIAKLELAVQAARGTAERANEQIAVAQAAQAAAERQRLAALGHRAADARRADAAERALAEERAAHARALLAAQAEASVPGVEWEAAWEGLAAIVGAYQARLLAGESVAQRTMRDVWREQGWEIGRAATSTHFPSVHAALSALPVHGSTAPTLPATEAVDATTESDGGEGAGQQAADGGRPRRGRGGRGGRWSRYRARIGGEA